MAAAYRSSVTSSRAWAAQLELSHTWCQSCSISPHSLWGKSTMASVSCHPGKCQQKWDWRLLVPLGAEPCSSSIYLATPCPASTNMMQVRLNIQALIETRPAPARQHAAVPLASGFFSCSKAGTMEIGRSQAGIAAGGQVRRGIF